MSKLSIVLALALPLCAAAQQIEQRGSAPWPGKNHFRFAHASQTPAGMPMVVEAVLPTALNPDSLRVFAGTSLVPAKLDWRQPKARIFFRSSGASVYHISFDTQRNGETQRLTEPAMIGSGDRLTFGRAGVRGRLSVGLWAHPAPIDWDGDGELDLVVACTDRPYNGIYLFRNLGTTREPLYDRALWLAPAKKDLLAADFNGDGAVDLVYSGGYYSDPRRNGLSKPVSVKLDRAYHIGRDDLWYPVDWDNDGKIDLLNGVSDWREYGWDDAYDSNGKWQNGPLHGYVWFHRNRGTNESPDYESPVMLKAGGKPIDLYGTPAPNPVDWFGRGVLDLIGGSFLDHVSVFRNTGTRERPVLADPEQLPFRMELCMIQPRTVTWHKDGRASLIVGEEDGTVSLVENLAPKGQAPKLAAPVRFEQVDPYMKSGVLSRPQSVDWNGDGKLDIVAGNSAGYLHYFENVGTAREPEFSDRGYLKAGGKVIRRIAGPNGSVQGPAEAKWGYSNPSVADWDGDGKLDILVNDIWGDVVWYRNVGTKTEPQLAEAQMIEVEWQGKAPKPDWVWWEPKPKQLLTQWRTTPRVVDWDRDGLADLVMLNHQGYLSLFRRARKDGNLVLLPPQRIFRLPNGRFLNLANGRAGSSGRRKIETVDWDGDGDLDLVSDSDQGPVWYENTGTQLKPIMQLRGTILKAPLNGHNPTPNAADWNGDGKLDLIIGAEDGFFYFFDRNYIESAR